MADESVSSSSEPIGEPTGEPAGTPRASGPSGPSSIRRTIAGAIPIILLVGLGALGYFGMTYLGATQMEDLSTAVLTVITFGALLIGVIVGGIVGSKIKQALLK